MNSEDFYKNSDDFYKLNNTVLNLYQSGIISNPYDVNHYPKKDRNKFEVKGYCFLVLGSISINMDYIQEFYIENKNTQSERLVIRLHPDLKFEFSKEYNIIEDVPDLIYKYFEEKNIKSKVME